MVRGFTADREYVKSAVGTQPVRVLLQENLGCESQPGLFSRINRLFRPAISDSRAVPDFDKNHGRFVTQHKVNLPPTRSIIPMHQMQPGQLQLIQGKIL